MPPIGENHDEGIELPPADQIRLIARDESYRAIAGHMATCPFIADNVSNRLRGLEISLARLIGIMIGAGILGGAAGGAVQHVLTKIP